MTELPHELELTDARALSEEFCEHFSLPYCEIYFVDRLVEVDLPIWKAMDIGAYATYTNSDPSFILIRQEIIAPVGILMHELTHHLEFKDYKGSENQVEHGYNFQLARKKVLKWCNNINDTYNWRIPLKAKIRNEDLEVFQDKEWKENANESCRESDSGAG
jgi:hypothetical protein